MRCGEFIATMIALLAAIVFMSGYALGDHLLGLMVSIIKWGVGGLVVVTVVVSLAKMVSKLIKYLAVRQANHE